MNDILVLVLYFLGGLLEYDLAREENESRIVALCFSLFWPIITIIFAIQDFLSFMQD